jgi:hypothetical protein
VWAGKPRQAHFSAFLATGSTQLQNDSQKLYFQLFGPQAHFEHFWRVQAKSLSRNLWKLILSISGACWLIASQEPSGS